MRVTRRFPIVALLALAAATAATTATLAPPASAQPSCPLFSYFTTNPIYPTDDALTVVSLFGCSPCADVASARVVTGTQVEVVLRTNAQCTDTVSVWQTSINLGVLPAGLHNLVITVRDEAHPDVAQVFGEWFTVTSPGAPPPPPPPPPPLPPAPQGPIFVGVTTVPSPASTARPTFLQAFGFYPTWCGFVSDAQVLAPDHVALTLRQFPECTPDAWAFHPADTAWFQTFNLGVLSAGAHDVTVSIRDATGDDSLKIQDFYGSFAVVDSGPVPPPPPPPPPIDSVMAPTPNPFLDQTAVGLIIGEDTNVEVAIFDAAGRRVRTIYRGPLAAGTRTLAWDGKRESGERARAGVYFYRVLQPGRTWARRVVLLPQR